MNATPEEVMQEIRKYFKQNKISQKEAASTLGYESTQTVYNILAGKKYPARTTALRFAMAYPFNIEYITSGRGQLIRQESPMIHGITQSYPTVLNLFVWMYATLLRRVKNDDIDELVGMIDKFIAASTMQDPVKYGLTEKDTELPPIMDKYHQLLEIFEKQ